MSTTAVTTQQTIERARHQLFLTELCWLLRPAPACSESPNRPYECESLVDQIGIKRRSTSRIGSYHSPNLFKFDTKKRRPDAGETER
jgi:hypothetical protein